MRNTNPDRTTPFVELALFAKQFGKFQAVYPSDLQIYQGETLALLGPNGGGKSTIIRSIVGAIHPSQGSITIDGKNATKHINKLKPLFSYLPQRLDFPGVQSARELLSLTAHLRGYTDQRVNEMLEKFSLREAADRPVREYSGGMIQRLALSICFLPVVPFYVLDEPTLNLDPFGTEQFRNTIIRLKQAGATILFTSHIIKDAVQLADRVAIVNKGKISTVESVPDFYEIVQNETEVRLVLQETSEQVISAASKAGARLTHRNGHHVSFRAHPEQRMQVIKAIEAAGGLIEEFRTVNPDWDTLLTDQFTRGENVESQS